MMIMHIFAAKKTSWHKRAKPARIGLIVPSKTRFLVRPLEFPYPYLLGGCPGSVCHECLVKFDNIIINHNNRLFNQEERKLLTELIFLQQ